MPRLLRFDVSSEDGNRDTRLKPLRNAAKNNLALEVLVNNAGISEDGFILRLKKESLDRTLQTNLVSAILLRS